MNNKEKSIKIQDSKPFETILGVGLQRLCPCNPWGSLQCPPRPPAACLGLLTTFITQEKSLHSYCHPNSNPVLSPGCCVVIC